MYAYYAHTLEGRPESEWQVLRDHLRNVAEMTAEFARGARPGDAAFEKAAYWAGLLHDIGKYSDEFQGYLRSKRKSGPETHHAVFGAKTAFDRRLCGPAFAVGGHHVGLHDLDGLQSLVEDPSYALPRRLPMILERFQAEFGAFSIPSADPEFAARNWTAEFYIRMLFSCLTDADFLDTEHHFTKQERGPVRLNDVRDLLIERLIAERDTKPRDGEVNRIRNVVFDRALNTGEKEQGFYSMTVPTGGGKTLSAMAFALSHARRHNLRRVIVAIPYLSIIEQNATDYRRILDPDEQGWVIEHHSAVAVPAVAGERWRSRVELAAENWDAPVVVTTSVQFIESLFGNSTSQCRKLHNMARSVVVLDEVQTLPVHLLAPLLNVLRELKDNYGVTFLFATATQPAFRRSGALPDGFAPGEVMEVAGEDAEEVAAQFRLLQRVRYEREREMDWETLASRMASSSQSLTVVNVRKHAFDLWEALRSAVPKNERDSVFHLSSAMCAEHRLQVLGEIREPHEGSIRHRLKAGQPCRVVSTQVVEAGVDLDFPLVFRAMGPLDSIVQAAGRCNREGRLRGADGDPVPGKVVLFTPGDHVVPPGIYRTATGQTEIFLARVSLDELAETPWLFGDYFSQLFQLAPTDYARGRGETIQEDRAKLRFKDVERKARVIEESGRPVVVPFGKGKDVIERIRSRAPTKGEPWYGRHDQRALQRFIVNVRQRDFERLQSLGMLLPLLRNLDVFVLEAGCYHRDLGVLIDRHPTEDLCGV